jgi:8-oxo-dGTP pyrophosphatase MutT (NUDIX family)
VAPDSQSNDVPNWKDRDGRSFFGQEASGVYILARDTGRILALKRSDNVRESRTWGIPGGKTEEGETPEQGATREVREEIGYKGADFDLLPLTSFKTKDGRFQYNNFLAVVDKEFRPSLDHETEAFKWVDSLDKWPDPLHPGVAFVAQDKESMEVIHAEQAHCDPDAKNTRQNKTYPPTLYHVVHGDMRGDTIEPHLANDQDPEPYVYATSNPRELLPYLTPNGTRIVNVQLPGSEDFITIIPDRENFLKNNTFGGTVYQLPGDGFEPSPRHKTQWVSRTPVKVSEENKFEKVDNMEGAMKMGLHILFTQKPCTPENYNFIDSIIKAPTFPLNLPRLIADGTLIYENALRKKDDPGLADYHVKVSSFLTGGSAKQLTQKPEQRQSEQPNRYEDLKAMTQQNGTVNAPQKKLSAPGLAP